MDRKSSLLALEKNILKYRAIQMILLLHQVESLRSFVLGTIKSTNSIVRGKIKHRIPDGTKNPLKEAWKILVEEGVITEDESKDLQNIIEIRNNKKPFTI